MVRGRTITRAPAAAATLDDAMERACAVTRLPTRILDGPLSELSTRGAKRFARAAREATPMPCVKNQLWLAGSRLDHLRTSRGR